MRDADAKRTGDQLVVYEPLRIIHTRPCVGHGFPLRFGIGAAEWKQLLLDEYVQRSLVCARIIGKEKSTRLGTIAEMTAARSLYASLGFTPIERYRPDEIVDTEFYELTLA